MKNFSRLNILRPLKTLYYNHRNNLCIPMFHTHTKELHLILVSKQEWTFSIEVFTLMKSTWRQQAQYCWVKRNPETKYSQRANEWLGRSGPCSEPGSGVTQLQPPTIVKRHTGRALSYVQSHLPVPVPKHQNLIWLLIIKNHFLKITKCLKTKTEENLTKPQYSLRYFR